MLQHHNLDQDRFHIHQEQHHGDHLRDHRTIGSTNATSAKVKLKKEVVPIGFKLNVKQKLKSKYVNPQSWNKLISKKDVMIIDVRKPFEYKVGTFKGAINPQVDSFKKFPKYFNKLKLIG